MMIMITEQPSWLRIVYGSCTFSGGGGNGHDSKQSMQEHADNEDCKIDFRIHDKNGKSNKTHIICFIAWFCCWIMWCKLINLFGTIVSNVIDFKWYMLSII